MGSSVVDEVVGLAFVVLTNLVVGTTSVVVVGCKVVVINVDGKIVDVMVEVSVGAAVLVVRVVVVISTVVVVGVLVVVSAIVTSSVVVGTISVVVLGCKVVAVDVASEEEMGAAVVGLVVLVSAVSVVTIVVVVMAVDGIAVVVASVVVVGTPAPVKQTERLQNSLTTITLLHLLSPGNKSIIYSMFTFRGVWSVAIIKFRSDFSSKIFAKHLTPCMSASLASTYLILSLTSITGDTMFTQKILALLSSVLTIATRNCTFDGRAPSLGCQLQNASCSSESVVCPGRGVINIRLVS